MDYNYPELNPVVILRLSYLEPVEEVLGVIYLRKESAERFKLNVKELLCDKFNLVELNHKSNFDEYLQKLDPITSLESDVCFMFIPFVLNYNIWKFTTPLNCIEYKNTKNVTSAKELFSNVELDMMTTLQLKGEHVEPSIEFLALHKETYTNQEVQELLEEFKKEMVESTNQLFNRFINRISK